MKFAQPLISGRLVKRYKRFLADVLLDDGSAVTAHCMNSGSMMGLCEPESRVWLSPATNPDSKLRYKWEIVEADSALIGINTGHPNRLAAEAIAEGTIGELRGYRVIRREVKYGVNSRIDLLLENHEAGFPSAYVEVKNVTLRRNGAAHFPDAVTARGAKHLAELTDMARAGYRAVMFYIVQRDDCSHFSLAGDIDPVYHTASLRAKDAGVETIVYHCAVSREEIRIAAPLAMRITGQDAKLMAKEAI